jgi:hypothetical protein
MRYLLDCIYWTYLFKSIKDNNKKNKTDWIYQTLKIHYARLNISEILFKNK